MLENHADILAGLSKLAVRKGRHILPIHNNLAARRPFQHIDAAYQRGLARTTQTNNAINLAFGNIQINAL